MDSMSTLLPMGRMIQVTLSLLMILILLFTWVSWPLTAHAILAEGFAVGGAVAFTIGTLLDLLMVTFGASSMDGAIRNQAAAQGQQPITYVGNLLNGYLSFLAENLNLPTVAQMFSRGTTYNSAGDIYLNEECTGFVADFQRWAWDEDGGDLVSYAPSIDASDFQRLPDGTEVLVLEASNLRDGRYLSVPFGSSDTHSTGSFYYLSSSSEGTVYYCYLNDGYIYFASNKPQGYASYYLNAGSGPYGRTVSLGITRRYTFSSTARLRLTTYLIDIPENSEVLSMTFDPNDLVASPSFVGDPETYPETGATQTKLSDGDIKAAIAAGHWQANIQDYLDSLANGYAGNVTSIPMTNEDTGEEETFPLTVPLDTPIAVDTVTDAEAGAQTDASEGVASDFLGTEAYTLDLTQFFPFCVPFDLYHILEKFEASAEAPAFTWTFDFGAAGTYDLEIDFDDFSSVAAILRDIETVAFAVGLILLTKRLIQGGD